MFTAESMGDRVRQIRQWRGLSLRKVAQELGVSPSLLSQVETGKSLPSVSTLYALAALLGVSADDLLGIAGRGAARDVVPVADRAPDVQRAAENPALEMEGGVRWERLASSPHRNTEAILVTYEPGATSSSEGKLVRHDGYEHALILEGELTLQLEFDEHVLGPGDSLQFDSARPHLFANRSDRRARGVWFLLGDVAPAPAPQPHPGPGPWSASTRAAAVDILRRTGQED